MAFLVSVGLFVFFGIVGFAVLGALYRRDDLVRTVLIAPAVGILVLIYLNYVLSRLGFPIGEVALPLTITVSTGALAALAWRRPPLPGRRGLPYIAVAGLAFGVCGWPLLVDGFAWLSHFNPDAGNYMQDTDRLVHRSFDAVADAATLRGQTDWGSYYVIYPLTGSRTGSDLLFAWAVSVTGRDEAAIYMPLIVSWHVAALSAATALTPTPHRFTRLLTAVVLATSALSSLGVMLQLLGQELGLCCLAAASVLLLSPFYRLAWPGLLRFVVLAGLVMAAFILSYPEMLPFLALGFLAYHARGFFEWRRDWRKTLLAVALVACCGFLLVARDAMPLINFLFSQAQAAETRMLHPNLFPYFLIPTGAGALWGLIPVSGYGGLIPQTPAIAMGFALSGVTLVAAPYLAWRREASATNLLVMIGLAVVLTFQGAGFGTLKLAMYMQPFLMPTLVSAFCRVLRASR